MTKQIMKQITKYVGVYDDLNIRKEVQKEMLQYSSESHYVWHRYTCLTT